MLTSTLNLGLSPVGQKLKCWRQLVTTTKKSSLTLYPENVSTKHKRTEIRSQRKHRPTRGWIVQSQNQDGVAKCTNLLFPSLERLLNALMSTASGKETFPEEFQKLGREVKESMESVQSEIETKSIELAEVKSEFELVSRELGETCQLLAACQEELEIATATVETLREEVQVARGGREDDNKSTLAKYRELEEALALAQVELEDRSISNDASGSTNGMRQLQDIVNDQEKVLGDLLVTLEEAESARMEAQQKVNKAEKETSEKADMVLRLEERQKALEGLVEDTKDALREAEKLWGLEREQYQSKEIELKDELIIATRKLDEKAKVVKDTKTSLEVLQFQFHQKVHLAETLELKCKSLEAEYNIISKENRNDLLPNMKTQLHVNKLEEEVAGLKSELRELRKRDQVWSEKTNAQSKDIEEKDKQLQDLKKLLPEIQAQLRQKSDALNSSQDVSRLSTLQAQQMSRYVKDLEKHIDRLKHELGVRQQKVENLSSQVESQHKLENDSKVSVAKLQRDLEKKIASAEHQLSKSNEWKIRVSELQAQLMKQEKSFAEQQDSREDLIAELRSQLLSIEKKQSSFSGESQAAKDSIHEQEEQHENLNGDSSWKITETSQLMRKVSALEVELKKSRAGHKALKNQLDVVRRSEQTAYEELKKMKTVGGNGVVQKGSIESSSSDADIDVSNTQIAASEAIVSDLKNQLGSLQQQLDEKETSIKKLESALAGEKSHAIEMSRVLNQDIEGLSKALEEQKNSFATLEKGRAAAEMKVKEMEDLLQAKMIELEEVKRAKRQNSIEQEGRHAMGESSLADIRRIAAEELEATAKLLAKAEQVALATRESMEASQERSSSSTTAREKQYQNELEVQVSTLKTLLEKQSLAASEAIQRSDTLEYEVSELSSKLSRLQNANQARKSTPDDVDSLAEQLSEALENNNAAEKEIQELQRKLLACEAMSIDSTILNKPYELKALKEQVDALEEENFRLKKIAARRNKVLAQSKIFIEKYLDQSIAPDKKQP